MNQLTLCCSGLTIYEIPEAVEVVDIVIVEESDLPLSAYAMGVSRGQPCTERWCRVLVKDAEVAKQISDKFNWQSQEQSARRWNVAAYFEVELGNDVLVPMLEELFGAFEYEHV